MVKDTQLEIDNIRKILNKREDWDLFTFLEHQLGVLDSKASTLLTLYSVVLSILLAIVLFINVQNVASAILIIIGLICVLLSAVFCSFITWTVWATSVVSEKDLTSLIVLRDRKTLFLKASIIMFLVGLTITLVSVAVQILVLK